MKKLLATAAVAVSVVGVTAGPALAIADDGGTTSLSGNGAHQEYGKACRPRSTPVLVPIAVQDVNVLSSPQNQQCTENSTQAKGDEPLSHILSDIPVLSGNGAGNS
ncbi:rodlin [Streptomyces griseus]|uniref:rodlin n=1 Tax=Streptomyces griseus TaxID=1911 RepID=UPI0004C53270|nr:rodlin [Streptomyces griseus]